MDFNRIASKIVSSEDEFDTIDVWRGMTGLTADEVSKLTGHNPDGKNGHSETDVVIPQSEMGWWSTRKGVAIAYASTDPVHGSKGKKGEIRYDVLLHGKAEVSKDVSGKEATFALRDANTSIKMVDVFYAVRGDNSRDRKSVLLSLSDVLLEYDREG